MRIIGIYRKLGDWLGCIILAMILVACSPSFGNAGSNPTPPKSTYEPPLYAGAQDIKVQIPYLGGKITSYHVDDKPADVLSFYADAMQKEGWSNVPVTATNKLSFGWARGGPKHSAYDFQVTVTQTNNGKTNVELTVGTEFPQ